MRSKFDRALDRLMACSDDPATRARIFDWITDHMVVYGQQIQRTRQAIDRGDGINEFHRMQAFRNIAEAIRLGGTWEAVEENYFWSHLSELISVMVVRP